MAQFSLIFIGRMGRLELWVSAIVRQPGPHLAARGSCLHKCLQRAQGRVYRGTPGSLLADRKSPVWKIRLGRSKSMRQPWLFGRCRPTLGGQPNLQGPQSTLNFDNVRQGFRLLPRGPADSIFGRCWMTTWKNLVDRGSFAIAYNVFKNFHTFSKFSFGRP